MNLRTRPRRETAFIAAGILVVLAIVYLHRSELLDDFFRHSPPSSFGFSSRLQIWKQCQDGCLDTIGRGATHLVKSKFKGDPLESLDLHIKFADMNVLLEDQQAAIRRGQLLNAREVPGSLIHGNTLYPIRVRLKGELPDHWSEPGRMSLRIKVRNGRTVLGFSSFSLHEPSARQHPYDPTYEDFVRATGALAVVHKYAKVSVNGEYWGIRNVEEHVTKELLEKQRKKASLIFKLSRQEHSRYTLANKRAYASPRYRLRDTRLHARAYGERRIRRNMVLRRQYSYVMQHLLVDGGDSLYDWPSMARAMAAAYVWGTNHTLLGENTRYYLNPYTLRLEPIMSDQSWPVPVEKYALVYPYPLPFRRFVTSKRFAQLYPAALQQVAQALPVVRPLFLDYLNLFPNDVHYLPEMVYQNLARGMRLGHREIVYLHEKVHNPSRFIYVPDAPDAQVLTDEIIAGLPAQIHVRHLTDGRVRVRNLLPAPVQLREIRSADGLMWDALPELPPLGRVDVDTGFDGIRDHEIEVVSRIGDHERARRASLSVIPLAELVNPLLAGDDTALAHALVRRGEDGYEITPGEWQVDRPVVLRGDVTIGAGTVLSFAPDAYLIIRGSLTVAGTESAPVRMQGINGKWKGLYVHEAQTPSRWRHFQIFNASEVDDGPLDLTGGVTLYRADLDADEVLIQGGTGEDALNIVESRVQLQDLEVRHSRSDAIDLDFCEGGINNLSIHHANGDGLDLSGSTIEVHDMRASKIGDKAISAGEATALTVRGATLTGVSVGIASKDASRVTGEDVTVGEVALHAAMTYRKKDFYGTSSLALSRFDYPRERGLVRQVGSDFSIDGVPVEASEVDVDGLYRTVMAK